MQGKREIHGITMIPFGLLAGFADEKEIRITELAESGFCFRTAEKIGSVGTFRICFYRELWERGDEREQEQAAKIPYREIEITSHEVEETVCEEFGISLYQYSVFVENETYQTCVRDLIGAYDRYIQLKLNCEDAELAEALTGYPAEKDGIFAKSLEEEKREWFETAREVESREENEVRSEACTGATVSSALETAIELDRPELYERYEQMEFPVFLEWYWKENHAEKFGNQMPFPSRIYVGNAFCHELLPAKKQLFAILEKADREGLSVTVTCSYLREFMLEPVEKLLDELEIWCKTKKRSLEIAANDWGMMELLKGRKEVLVPCLGTLLNKRKKDPRMRYKKGDPGLLRENSLNAEWYREYVRREFGIQRYEWESCGYRQQFPDGENSLHVPFYQTNTSQYCTLYAVCKNGDRGRQELPEKCPRYCAQDGFLYPKHLKMTGRYNSLFALDEAALSGMMDPDQWIKEGIDRIVVGFL